MLAAVSVVALVAACGGSTHHPSHAQRSPTRALPQRAHVVFASDTGAALGNVSSAHVAGKVISSLGFDPSRDGFSFQNYGFIAGNELDAHAMRELFGDVVCATAPSDTCTLTPAAAQWAQQTAEAMVGGHCFGFSMTALRFFKHNLSPSTYGASIPYSLGLSPELQSEIAYGWATQVVPAVQQAELVGQPSAVVKFLARAMRNPSGEVYSLGLYNGPPSDPQREGHAVTPTGIASLGNGKYAILLYDNNKPGTTQAMLVDAKAETWQYLVATNPSQPNAVWSGQGTANELALAPLSSILHQQQCPFCSAAGRTGVTTISLGGNPVAHAHLLITTSDGRRLGYVGHRFVNQIKGARVIRPALNQIWKATPEPVYVVPANDQVKITLSGGNPTGSDAAQVHVSGPGFGATVARLMPRAGAQAEITLTPGGAKLSLRLSGAPGSAPTLQLARDQGRKGNLVTVAPTRLKAGTKLSVGLRPTSHRVSVTSSQASSPVAVTLRSVGPQGIKTVQKQNVAVHAGQPTTLSLGLIRVG
ncbi:MAG: hypothetical protein DLM61_03740 [Pseudonocardiales bacterium]|nr:MAG: hypothetical protein DLM61_03740 [Pseudonocardiales bacterium]